MRVLYISSLCSPEKVDYLYKVSNSNPGFAAQKFNRMVAKGLSINGCIVETLSAPPVSRLHKLLWDWKSEKIDGITYNYIPCLNIKLLKQLCQFLYSFLWVLSWGKSQKKERVIVCDMLVPSVNMAVLLASKIIGIKSVGVLTDMPGLALNRQTIMTRLSSLFTKLYMGSFKYYVFLTEHMNPVVNKHNKPYIVMEGLVEPIKESPIIGKRKHRIVYAGGIFERYGLKKLVEAFLLINQNTYTLHLFGEGSLVTWIKEQSREDSRLVYHGVKPNAEVIDFEQESLLLVNPRPTKEKLTLYSFPSKNLEYMLSGTAVITTDLPGMPQEYKDFVLIFDDESVDGIKRCLESAMSMSDEYLIKKGLQGHNWVREKKNNIYQTKRILNLIQE